jgi:ribosomal protein S18 acetylase RimI-like enzyme
VAGQPGHQVNLALRHDGRVAGDVYVHVLAASPHAVELGITLAPWAQGKGLAAEAITTVVDAAFAGGSVVKAIAYVDVRNAASLALFDRLGFRREGHLTASFDLGDGTYADEVLFGLTTATWRQRVDEPVVVTDPHPADLARLHELLYGFNVAATGIADGQEWAAFVRDDLGVVTGAVSGTVWGEAGEVHVLWVHEAERHRGLGTKLLAAAEAYVRAHGGRHMYLTTHTFQAVAFYERQGYQRCGAWTPYPRGHGVVFFGKELTA